MSSLSHHGRNAATVLLVAAAFLVAPRQARSQSPAGADSLPAWLARSRLVFGASRYAQDVSEAPASVTIVTAEEIEGLALRTLGDILSLGAGVFTHYDRNYSYATFRGMSRQSDFNTRILVLVDGHRINDAASDAAGIGTDALIDVSAIEQVEIISGPGSVLFGTNAFFGVVNIVTRHGARLNGLGIRVEGGSFGVSRSVLTWGGRRVGHVRSEGLLSLAAENRRGHDLYFPEFDGDSSDGMSRNLDGEYAFRALAKGRRGDFSVMAATGFRFRRVPTASYDTRFNDPRLHTRDRTTTTVATYEHAFADLSRIFISTAFDSYAYQGEWPYESTVTHDYNDSRTWTVESQYLRFLGGGNKLALGAEARWLSEGRVGVYDEGAPSPFVDLNRSLAIGAAFAQLEWRLGDRSILYAGARHDRYEGVGGTTNPRLALIVRPAPGLTVKALHSRAFRAPNLYELFYEDGGYTQKAPSSLVPETVRSTELSIDKQLGPRLTGSVAAYRIGTSDLINLVTDSSDGLLIFGNEGQPRSTGIEFKVAASIGYTRVRAAWAVQRARSDDDRTPVNSPRQLGNMSLLVPLRSGNIGLLVRHVGTRPTLRGSEAPAYTVVGATLLLKPFGNGAEFMVQSNNLFDARYADPGGEEHAQDLLARDGRSVRLGLRYRFR
jgi:iron complex outermembrane receptor protein